VEFTASGVSGPIGTADNSPPVHWRSEPTKHGTKRPSGTPERSHLRRVVTNDFQIRDSHPSKIARGGHPGAPFPCAATEMFAFRIPCKSCRSIAGPVGSLGLRLAPGSSISGKFDSLLSLLVCGFSLFFDRAASLFAVWCVLLDAS
jgi:hypothetical protein